MVPKKKLIMKNHEKRERNEYHIHCKSAFQRLKVVVNPVLRVLCNGAQMFKLASKEIIPDDLAISTLSMEGQMRIAVGEWERSTVIYQVHDY